MPATPRLWAVLSNFFHVLPPAEAAARFVSGASLDRLFSRPSNDRWGYGTGLQQAMIDPTAIGDPERHVW